MPLSDDPAPAPDPSHDRCVDPLVCFCMRVRESTLRDAIRGGARSVDALRNATRASSGCGTCRIDLIALLHDEGARDAD